jgi:hypothetical protein
MHRDEPAGATRSPGSDVSMCHVLSVQPVTEVDIPVKKGMGGRLASGHGATAVRVNRCADLDEALSMAFAAAGPVLVEVCVT